MSHFYFLRKKNLGLRNKFFCPKNAFTLFHIAMNTLYIGSNTEKNHETIYKIYKKFKQMD